MAGGKLTEEQMAVIIEMGNIIIDESLTKEERVKKLMAINKDILPDDVAVSDEDINAVIQKVAIDPALNKKSVP